MRIVYDDKMQNEFVDVVEMFMDDLSINYSKYIKYEWGTETVQMDVVKEKLNILLTKDFDMEIGKNVTHAHSIGNNCKYPVYYHPEGIDEIQHCAYINIIHGMYGEGYLNCEDYNGNKIGASYKISKWGVGVIEGGAKNGRS